MADSEGRAGVRAATGERADPLSSGQRIEQARQLLDLIRAEGLRPVLVLDDTDKWLNTAWQPDAATVRAAFFGRVIRVLAEELSTAAVLAVHPVYLGDDEYRAAAVFIDTTIHVPPIPGAGAVGSWVDALHWRSTSRTNHRP